MEGELSAAGMLSRPWWKSLAPWRRERAAEAKVALSQKNLTAVLTAKVDEEVASRASTELNLKTAPLKD
eukprot:3133584-Rhodomonas_salina.1